MPAEPYQAWRRRLLSDGLESLKKEYLKMPEDPGGTCVAFNAATAAAEQPKHSPNRYNNIPLFDHTRVTLNDGIVGSYIHASYIDGYNNAKKAFIITQAPLKVSIAQYWRMVWQENVQVCVCLTSLVEERLEKSTTFFPMALDRPVRAGPFRVVLNKMEQSSQRKLVTCELKMICWFPPMPTRTVYFILYGDWPDRGVPDNPSHFLSFLDHIRSVQERSRDKRSKSLPPLLVNCSAGVGRSATLVASMIEVERLRASRTVYLESTVSHLRTQRKGAVQNLVQYVFVARIIAEAYQRLYEYEEKSVAVTQRPMQSMSVVQK